MTSDRPYRERLTETRRSAACVRVPGRSSTPPSSRCSSRLYEAGEVLPL